MSKRRRRAWRPLIMGRQGAVATNHPAATAAGELMLRAGGNAFDAGAAISFTLGVVEPHMSGLGGDAFLHLYDARAGHTVVYNGSGPAPMRATVDAYREGIPSTGPKAVSTPGFLAAVHQAHHENGRLPWKTVCAPAIDAAENGFAATENFVRFSTKFRKRLLSDPHLSELFLPNGKPPQAGALIYQPALARTLHRLSREGAEDFYRGELGRQFCLDLADLGALLSEDDIRGFKPEKQPSIGIKYRGFDIRQTPPNSSGFVLLQALKIVERFALSELEEGSAELLHILVEAKKLAFRDRERFAADPRTITVPLDELFSEETAERLARSISRDQAAFISLRPMERAGGNTTYFCVVDSEGNAVSGMQSLNNPFGAGVLARRTGILLNNRMVSWHLEPGHVNMLHPGKRVRHTMNAPFIFRDGKLWAVFGTPGADSQVQVNLQAVVSMIDLGLDPQIIAEAPRWNSEQIGQDSIWPHYGSDALFLEGGFEQTTVDGLRAKGHVVKIIGRMDGPCSLACIRVLENGVRMAGSDPRWDGWAAAI